MILRLIVTLSPIIMLVRRVDFTGLGQAFKDLNIPLLLSGLGLFFRPGAKCPALESNPEWARNKCVCHPSDFPSFNRNIL